MSISVERVLARHERNRKRCKRYYLSHREARIRYARSYRQEKRDGTFIPKAVLRDPEQREAIRRMLAIRPDYRFD